MPCRNRLRLLAVLGLALLLVVPHRAGADPFSVSGNLNYRENGGDDLDTQRSLNQSYNLNFIKQLSSAMDFSAATRYNNYQDFQGTDDNDSSSINPSAAFDLRNEWFSLNLNGSQNRMNDDESPPLFNRTWGGNLYSQIEKWPNLRLHYNQSQLWDDQRDHDQDVESTDYGGSVEYAWKSLAMLYDVRRGESDDLVEDINTETLNQYAQLKYTESFFRDRLSIGASQQYSSSEIDTDAAVGEDGVVMQPITLLSGLSTVSKIDPRFVDLTSTATLVNGDTSDESVQILPQDSDVYVHIGIEAGSQPVSRMEVYFDKLLSPGEQGALAGAIWTVYRSDDNQRWNRVGEITPAFDSKAGRSLAYVDLSVPVTDRYLKMVVSSINISAVAPSVYVSEVRAGELIFTTADRLKTSSKFVSHQTQLNIGYRLAPGWSTGYSMRRVLNLPESDQDNLQTTHALNTSYAPSRYFAMALGASETRDNTQKDNEARTLIRSYSAAFNSSPLDTLDVSFGYTRTYGYEGDEEADRGDTIHGNIAAEIFPDWTMSFSPSWTRNRSFPTDRDREDSAQNQVYSTTTTTYGFVLTSSARFTPRLNLTGNWNYAHSTSDSEDELEEARATNSRQYGATLSYRPSDVLLLSTSYRRDVDADDTALSGTLAWLLTRTLQLNAGASFGMESDDSDQYTSTINWSVSRNLALQAGGAYQVAKSGNVWSLMSSLNAHY
ncbi:MAG: hypothetical protein RBT64_06345 [Trichloromonas sp.]|jgi:hypothetical protein|nr:hypothetical protein [Trichloromonas sp.]